MARRLIRRDPIRQLTTGNQLKQRNAEQRNLLHTLFLVETAKSILANNQQYNNPSPPLNVNLLLATDLTYRPTAGVGLEPLTITPALCLTKDTMATLGIGHTEKVIEFRGTNWHGTHRVCIRRSELGLCRVG